MCSRYYSPYYVAQEQYERSARLLVEPMQTGDAELIAEAQKARKYLEGHALVCHHLWQERGGTIGTLWPIPKVQPEETEAEHRAEVNAVRYSGAW